MGKLRFYAVANGYGGPNIYLTWWMRYLLLSHGLTLYPYHPGPKPKRPSQATVEPSTEVSKLTKKRKNGFIPPWRQDLLVSCATPSIQLPKRRKDSSAKTATASLSNSMHSRVPTASNESATSPKRVFQPRLTTRYTPYPSSSASDVPSSFGTRISSPTLYSHGVPPSEHQEQMFQLAAIAKVEEEDSKDAIKAMLGLSSPSQTSETLHQIPSSDTSCSGALQNVSIPASRLPEHEALVPEQTAIFERVMKGSSIFFTGSAGVGKSVLLRAIIRGLRAKYPQADQIGVTATTGIAATNIGGCTLHSWAGCGLGKEPMDRLLWKIIKGNKPAATRWRSCRALVIDEGMSWIQGSIC